MNTLQSWDRSNYIRNTATLSLEYNLTEEPSQRYPNNVTLEKVPYCDIVLIDSL